FTGRTMVFDYPAKGSVRRVHTIDDPLCLELGRSLKRGRGGQQLLAYKDDDRWSSVRSDEINDYLKSQMGDDFSAKDFRPGMRRCWPLWRWRQRPMRRARRPAAARFATRSMAWPSRSAIRRPS